MGAAAAAAAAVLPTLPDGLLILNHVTVNSHSHHCLPVDKSLTT